MEKVVIFSASETQCVTIEEIAIEKWVGLTRRIMAIERGYHHDDRTLIRYVYDLNAIKQMGKITDNFFDLARIIINRDAKQFKNLQDKLDWKCSLGSKCSSRARSCSILSLDRIVFSSCYSKNPRKSGFFL